MYVCMYVDQHDGEDHWQSLEAQHAWTSRCGQLIYERGARARAEGVRYLVMYGYLKEERDDGVRVRVWRVRKWAKGAVLGKISLCVYICEFTYMAS